MVWKQSHSEAETALSLCYCFKSYKLSLYTVFLFLFLLHQFPSSSLVQMGWFSSQVRSLMPRALFGSQCSLCDLHVNQIFNLV